ncbi:MAG: Inosose dehydratase [Verrucomicrobia subdivision 3 bacterium]|nr:Inosose dehydratase [Limisphaerales bacterium]MCS1415448.1 Inosose dehydratase [Limisphaerales bacterium]
MYFMKEVIRVFGVAVLSVGISGSARAWAEIVYENDFQTVEIGEESEGFLVLGGDFAVRAAGENRFLELPGAPLGNFGALFGSNTKEGSCVSVSVQSEARQRLAPAFGVGVNGLGGFRLMVSANKRRLELLRGDEVVASVNHRWQSQGWTRMVLEAAPASKALWRVRGKVWSADDTEPDTWMITYASDSAPPRGRPSIWGHPFSGRAIRFDDLVVAKVPARGSGAKIPFELGLQTWTVRNMSFDQAVAFAAKHQFKWLAMSRMHMDPRAPMDETRRKKAALEQNGLKAYTFGVARTSLAHEYNRQLFEFAKFMGIRLIVVEPDDFKTFESLERLVKEYDIKVAIHNHGIRTLYGNPLVVRNVIKHLDPRIGVCLDTGWVTAAGFDASKVFREYDGRVFDVHLKDKRIERTQGDDVYFDTHIGAGEGNLARFLETLKEAKFSGVLALETDHPEFARVPGPFVTKAIEFFQSSTRDKSLGR